MRRLHMQLYVAIIGTLVAFSVAGMAVWHYFATPRGALWGVEAAAGLSARLLTAPEGEGRRSEIIDSLADQVHASALLLRADGTTEYARRTMPRIDADQLTRHGWALTHDGPVFIQRLSDGRRLIVYPYRRFLMHGVHVGLILIGIAVTLALLTYPISRRLTARLARLEEGVRQFGGGNLAVRVKVEGRDEVAALARSFNESAARVETLVRSHQLLLANCSHELRTPLTRLRMAVENLPARDELAKNIAELDALIEEMLLASRLDASAGIERSESVDLLALAAEEAAHFDREVEGEAVNVRGDARLLRRLVRNLLENARLHGGGATLVRVGRTTNGAELLVEDAGPGIAEADRARIFEPFQRAGATGSATGAGLGLSIVRQIARAHGGTVEHEPRVGGGSRFRVSLPN